METVPSQFSGGPVSIKQKPSPLVDTPPVDVPAVKIVHEEKSISGEYQDQIKKNPVGYSVL